MQFRILDCWRFVAALLVMIYHFSFFAPYGAVAITDFMYRMLPLLDLFFMISGFFIATHYADRLHSLNDFGRFMRRRLARLYPLHLLTTAFFVGVAVFAWAIDAQHYAWRESLAALPETLGLVHALGTTDGLYLNFVSWSVSAEVFAYLCFPLLLVFLRRGGLVAMAGFVAAWVVGLEIASIYGVFASGHWTDTATKGAVRAFADFGIGAVVAIAVARRLIRVTSFWPGLALLALALVSMLTGASVYLDFALLASALALCASAEMARPDATARLRPLMPLTASAFGVYLWHPIMEFVFLEVIWMRLIDGESLAGFYAYLLVPMGVTVAVAILSLLTFERMAADFINGKGLRKPWPAGAKREPASLY